MYKLIESLELRKAKKIAAKIQETRRNGDFIIHMFDKHGEYATFDIDTMSEEDMIWYIHEGKVVNFIWD